MSEPLIEDLIASSLQQSPELHVHMLATECVLRKQRIALLEAGRTDLADLIRRRYPRMMERGNPLYDAVLADAVQRGGAVVVPRADRFESCPKNHVCTPPACEAGNGEWPRCPKGGDGPKNV